MNCSIFDVVVLGAGSAGSAAAYQLARRGYRVAILDAKRRSDAGARWVDAIPPWMFAAAGLENPEPPELIPESGVVQVRAWEGDDEITLPTNPLWNIDMRHLVARLQRLCLEEGVEIFDQVENVVPMLAPSGRPVRLRATRRAKGSDNTLDLAASLFVDATGTSRALLDQIPLLRRHCPPAATHESCQAAQFICRIEDRDAAVAYFSHVGLQPGDSLSWLSIEGGYSTLGIHVENTLDRVGLLAGGAVSGDKPSGSDIIARFRAEHSWVGEAEFGGTAIIPLRRPYARLGAEGIALIGNSACQVFPAHGSGVGTSLLAARLLADSVAQHDDPGSHEAVWGYQAAFHRGHGAWHNAYDVIRRMSAELSRAEVQRMVGAGLMSAASVDATLLQGSPDPSVRDALSMIRAVARHPVLTGRVSHWLARVPALFLLSKRYPRRVNMKALARWEQAVAALACAPPDLPHKESKTAALRSLLAGA